MKIGQSTSPMDRMAELRTMNAAEVEILTIISENEATLHAKFQHLRHHGEWFRVRWEIMSYLHEIGEHEAADRLGLV